MSDKIEAPKDGGIWICHTCKTVIGPIVDDDKNMCGCDVYEFEISRYVPDSDQLTDLQSKLSKAEADVERLSQQVCDECSPDDYGWNYNRVEGRVPCVCITESGAYQELGVKLKEAVELLKRVKTADYCGGGLGGLLWNNIESFIKKQAAP